MPSREETDALQRFWGPAHTSTRRVPLTEVDVSRNYERCKGEGVAIVMDSWSRVILLKRSSTDVPRDSGTWVLPSGRIRLLETIEDGTVREVREETGLDVRLLRLLRTDWVITEFRTWVNKRLHFTFLARSYGGALNPRDQQEILEAEWFLPDELPAIIQPPWLREFLLKDAALHGQCLAATGFGYSIRKHRSMKRGSAGHRDNGDASYL